MAAGKPQQQASKKEPDPKAEEKPKERKSAALTILPAPYDPVGIYAFFDVTLGSKYVSGGYELDPAAFGRAEIVEIIASSPDVIVTYDGTLHCSYEHGDEAKASDDLSKVTARCCVIGPPA